MSQVNENIIRKLVRELIKQELDEANSTASAGGQYNTPHAFAGSNKKGKGKGKAGYTGGHDDPTDGTGHFIASDPDLRGGNEGKKGKKYMSEGRYHAWRNDDTFYGADVVSNNLEDYVLKFDINVIEDRGD